MKRACTFFIAVLVRGWSPDVQFVRNPEAVALSFRPRVLPDNVPDVTCASAELGGFLRIVISIRTRLELTT